MKIAQQLPKGTWRGLPRVSWDHGTYFLWHPSPLPMSHGCSVLTQSPHTLLKGRVQACVCGQKTT